MTRLYAACLCCQCEGTTTITTYTTITTPPPASHRLKAAPPTSHHLKAALQSTTQVFQLQPRPSDDTLTMFLRETTIFFFVEVG